MATPSHIVPADLSFSVENDIDFEDTAKIANASFGFKRPRFSAAFLRWLHGKASAIARFEALDFDLA